MEWPRKVENSLQRSCLIHTQGRSFDEGIEVEALLRLHQSEVPGWPCQCFIIPERHQHLFAQCLAQQQFVALAGGAVQDDAREFQVLAIARETMHQRGCRLGLMAAVEREQHGQTQHHCEIGRRPLGPARSVEEAHDPFDDDEVGIAGQFTYQAIDLTGVHRPWIEVVAGPASGRLVEARVDVVGPHLGRGNAHPAISEGSQKSQRNQGLAAAR